MANICGLLITVRTARQGIAMVSDKSSPEYQEEVATLQINPDDLTALGLEPGGRARLISTYGEAIVTCQPAEVPGGLFFLPLGPVANQVIGTDTQGTGVPDFKGLEVKLEPWQDRDVATSGRGEKAK